MFIKTSELPEVITLALSKIAYNKKDIDIQESTTFRCQDSSGNGYRAFMVIVNLTTKESQTTYGSWGGANMFNPRNHVDLDDTLRTIPEDCIIIHGTQGGSKPVSAYINVRPENMVKFITEKAELSLLEKKAISIICSYKPSYRANEFFRQGLGSYNADGAVVSELIKKGLVKVTASGALSITTEGKNANLHSTRSFEIIKLSGNAA